MGGRGWLMLLGLAVLGGGWGPPAAGQGRACDGQQILQPGKCAGDELDGPERQLAALINQYRAEQGLPAIALSPALSLVANRHVRDMAMNSQRMTHDWSNCPMAQGGACMWNAPQVLGTGYPGNGYENAWGWGGTGPIDPARVFRSWKEHAPHDDVMVNRNRWRSRHWQALGVGMFGQYAVIWFGEEADPAAAQ